MRGRPGSTARIERMIAATRTLEFIVTRTETEALLLEANLIKRLRPRFNVVLRDDKSFPLYSDHVRPLGAANPQASRRAHAAGPLLWTVRLGLGGQPHGQCAAARVSAALMQRSVLREPHAAVPALSDQALLGAVHQGDRFSAIMRCWCAKRTSSCPAAARRSRTSLPRRWKRPPPRSISSAPRSTATGSRRCRRSSRSRASIHAVSKKPTSSRCTSRAAFPASRCSSSAPGRTGATAPIFPRPTARFAPGEVLTAFLAQFYDDKPPPRLILISHAISDRALLAQALSTKSGRKVEVLLPQRGEKKDLIEHALANAREALGRKLAETTSQEKLAAPARRDFRPAARAAPDRGLRQQPHPRLQCGRRHDRGRARKGFAKASTANSISARPT